MKINLSHKEKIYGPAGVLLALFGFGWFKLSRQLGAEAAGMRAVGQHLGNQLSRLWSIIPFPVSELVWIGGIAGGLVMTGLLIRRRGLSGLTAALSRLLLCGGMIYALFSVVFLTQYSAPPLADQLGMESGKYAVEELADTAAKVAAELNAYAQLVERDADGLFAPADYDELAETVQQSYRAGSMAALYGRGAGIAPKQGVLLSKIMSYLNITGYYFPITGESIVSSDLIETSIPFTIAHETAHSFGVGPEKEANFAAFLCCIESGDAELAYSGLFNGYIYLNNALYGADRDLWRAVYDTLCSEVRADLAAKNAHLKRYEGAFKKVGNTVNDTYIRATGQPEGLRSYGLMVDLIISYYKDR